MGNKPGCSLKKKDIKAYSDRTNFTPDEVVALHNQFRSIKDSDDDSEDAVIVLNRSEFQRALGFGSSFFVDRIFDLFDEDKDGNINFGEFICGIAVLSTKSTPAMKIKFSFQVYDLNADGKIDREELGKLLQEALRESHIPLTPAQVTQLVEDTFAEADQDRDGFIDEEEYKRMVAKHQNMLKHITLNVSEIIKEAAERAAARGAAPAGSA